MEKEINADQMRLLALIESKSFAELSTEEKAFVLKNIRQRDYELQHLVLCESAILADEVEPRKLIIAPTGQKGRVVPLYQAVAGIAAAILLTFFLVRGEQDNTLEVSEPILAQIDTVYVDRTEYDTVVHYQTKYIVQRISEDPDLVCCTPSTSESSNLNFLPIGNYNLKNKGSSASEDESLTQLVNFSRIN